MDRIPPASFPQIRCQGPFPQEGSIFFLQLRPRKVDSAELGNACSGLLVKGRLFLKILFNTMVVCAKTPATVT